MSTTAAALTTLVVVLAVAGAYCLGYRTSARVIAVRLARIAEAAARPPGPHPAAVADEIALGWQQLYESCCLRGWESGVHDPATCIRKDHHA